MSDDEMSGTMLESLQHANPVRVEDIADRRALPSAHALIAEITAQPHRRVRRRTVVVAIVLLVILALAALIGTFAIVHRGRPVATAGPLCYEAPSLNARKIATSGGGDLRAACAALWKEGDFGAGPVPSHFDACVLPGGAPAVFPAESGSVCKTLGLPEANPTSTDDRIARAGAEAGLALGGPGRCIGYDRARVIVQRILEQNGLHGWTVALNPQALAFSAERPCASPAVTPERKTVFLIPGPVIRSVPPTTG